MCLNANRPESRTATEAASLFYEDLERKTARDIIGNHNPSNNPAVDKIKAAAVELIIAIHQAEGIGSEDWAPAHWNELAVDNVVIASMLAVKAATFKQ